MNAELDIIISPAQTITRKPFKCRTWEGAQSKARGMLRRMARDGVVVTFANVAAYSGGRIAASVNLPVNPN